MNGKRAKMLRKIALGQIQSWTQIETGYESHKVNGYTVLVPHCYKGIYSATKKWAKRDPETVTRLMQRRQGFPTIGAVIRALHGQYIRDMHNKEHGHNHS